MATDQKKVWTGLGLAPGTVLTSGNINTAGNGDNQQWIVPTGSPVLTTRQPGGTQGNGVELDSTVTTEVMRVDFNSGSSNSDSSQDAALIWLHFKYKPTNNPATADHALVLARSASAAAGNIYHSVTTATAFGIQFRNSLNATITSALTGSPTFSNASGKTAALVTGDVYEIDFAVHQGGSSSTGRIQGRVKSVSNPGTWNGGVEHYFDTGYTVNTATDLMRYFRFYKPVAGSTLVDAQFTELEWGTKVTPVTSLDKTLSIANFRSLSPPAIDDGDSGPLYAINPVGTAIIGGALTYTMQAQVSGPAQTPLQRATNFWTVTQDSNVRVYRVLVSEAGNASTATMDFTVPVASALSGQYRRRVWNGTVWT